jgi:hypothetical protein
MVHAGPITPRSRMPGGPLLGYSASQSSVLRYLALDGTDHASRHGRGSMIRRLVICGPQPRSAPTATPPPGPGRRVRRLTQHWPAVRGHARQAAKRSSPERTAPAIAGSRNARTGKARQPGCPGLPGTPRRPRAHTDHMSHSSPTACRPLPGPGPPTTHIDYSPRQSGFPAGRSCGRRTHRPAQSWPAAPVAIIAPGPHSALAADSADSRARHTTRVPSACPSPLIQSLRSPARYRPGPRCAARDQRQRETLPSAPCLPD